MTQCRDRLFKAVQDTLQDSDTKRIDSKEDAAKAVQQLLEQTKYNQQRKNGK